MKLTKAFFEEVRKRILSARATVARGVDLVQVHTHFEIGRRIVEQEQKGKDRAAYGDEVIKALSQRLTTEFGTGFSKRNLELMRRFFLMALATGVVEWSRFSMRKTGGQRRAAHSPGDKVPNMGLRPWFGPKHSRDVLREA